MPTSRPGQFGRSPLAALDLSTCPGGAQDAGWTLSTTTFDPAFYRHAVVGNGYLGQRVPPTGMGYMATGEETGWPLFTPRYDGAFVAGLYGQDPGLAGGRQAVAAIPTWSTLEVGAGAETYTATTPAARISNYRQALLLRCGLLSTALTWTTSDGKSTNLAYDVLADRGHPHVGAVRVRMTPHWDGQATVSDRIDGAGARRLVQTGGGSHGPATVDVTFSTQTTGTAGTVASTVKPGAGVAASPAKHSIGDGDLSASQSLTFPVRCGQSYEFVKYVGVDTALTSAKAEKVRGGGFPGCRAAGLVGLAGEPRRRLGRPLAERHRAARPTGPPGVDPGSTACSPTSVRIRTTASARSTCRATSPWPCGSTTWRPGTPPGCGLAAGRCCRASPSSGPDA